MKKLISFIILLALSISLFGCAKAPIDSASPDALVENKRPTDDAVPETDVQTPDETADQTPQESTDGADADTEPDDSATVAPAVTLPSVTVKQNEGESAKPMVFTKDDQFSSFEVAVLLTEEETNKNVVASAVIRTFYHDSIIYNELQTEYKRTGRILTKNNISLWGINFNSKTRNKYKLYESETHQRYAFLNLFLPIKIEQTVYYELEKEETTIPFQDMETLLKSDLQTKTLAIIPTNAEVKNTTYTTHQEGTRIRLDCYIETFLTITKN